MTHTRRPPASRSSLACPDSSHFDENTLLPQKIRRNGQDEDVDRLSGGKLAYVHLPDTGSAGYLNFNRYFYRYKPPRALHLIEGEILKRQPRDRLSRVLTHKAQEQTHRIAVTSHGTETQAFLYHQVIRKE